MKIISPQKWEIARSAELPIRVEKSSQPRMACGRRDSTGAKLSAWNEHRRHSGPILSSIKAFRTAVTGAKTADAGPEKNAQTRLTHPL